MATKEDILEQVVEEYLIHQGYFVRHNIKFRPSKEHQNFVSNQDSNHSDIDVIGLHPLKSGVERIVVVGCKSWQGGFKPTQLISAIENKKKVAGREAWKGHRELIEPKWTAAFVQKVQEETGSSEFTYVNAVTKLVGDRADWEQYALFRERLGSNPIRVITFEEMVGEIWSSLSTTLAATEIGRLLQLFRSAGLDPFKP